MSNPTFADVSVDLNRTLAAVLPALRSMTDADAAHPRAVGKWSAKQVIGHLIDSASNNHQRFVRAQQGALTFPPYEQEHWVACQDHAGRAWSDLVVFWEAYNRHLAHVISRIPDARQSVACIVEDSTPVTLGFLASDYVVHMRHHLAQIGAWTEP